MDGNAAFYEALTGRDRGADGVFFYGVKSTGIYCRPSCPARSPRPENTVFFATAAAARAAGYRACKRCRPDGEHPEKAKAELIAASCRAIEASEASLPLAALAAAAGMSAFHFHRLFRAVTGVTPKSYAAARRAAKARHALAESKTVTAAIYEAGFGSSGRFYAAAALHLGMAPAAFRKGGAGEALRVATAACALGVVLVASTEKGICAIALGDDGAALEADLARQFPHAGGAAGGADVLAAVVALVEGAASAPDLPLDIRGTVFQQRVWAALRQIPAGRTASYAEIAAGLGLPHGARAVAAACAANRLAVAVPCHRVLRGDGGLAGYRWGLERKRALLSRESEG